MIKVKQLMSKKVATINKGNNVIDSAKVMREFNCGSIIIVENDTPVGILTETDLLKKVIAEGKNLYETTVDSVMTNDIISAQSSDTISETSRRMSLAKIRRMPVMENNKLVGVISTTDIRRYMKELERDLLDLT